MMDRFELYSDSIGFGGMELRRETCQLPFFAIRFLLCHAPPIVAHCQIESHGTLGSGSCASGHV